MAGIVSKRAPIDGLWRVARGPNPFWLKDPAPPLRKGKADVAVGNRFDSALGNFKVWYFATELEGCYGETLAPFRPDPAVKAAVDDEEGFMAIGHIPADWRTRRVAVRATFPEPRPFVDAESASTRKFLTDELPWLLDFAGIDEIDVAAIRSRDRRLTRWIAQWVWHQRWQDGGTEYAGVRFCSRLNSDWELWAVFEDVLLKEEERRSVLVQDDALRRVADLFGLNIF